ncbi:hypothetical protein [Streptomyces sp. enrichment culture]
MGAIRRDTHRRFAGGVLHRLGSPDAAPAAGTGVDVSGGRLTA